MALKLFSSNGPLTSFQSGLVPNVATDAPVLVEVVVDLLGVGRVGVSLRCGPPAEATFHAVLGSGKTLLVSASWLLRKKPAVVGLVELEDDVVLPGRADAGYVLRDQAWGVLTPVGGADRHRGLQQVDLEDEVVGIDRLAVRPLEVRSSAGS